MSGIGADLRQARLARKQTIDDISRATKITTSLVQAIENDAFAKLPGGLFTRAFLRAYAREVRLDPEELVARYRAEFEPTTLLPTVEPDTKRGSALAPTVRPPEISDDAARTRNVQILQLCVVLLIVALYFALVRRPGPEAGSDVKPVAPVAATPAAETPVATNGTSAPADAPLTFEVRPTATCWVEATVDGQPAIRGLMEAGQSERVIFRDAVRLRIGEPSAFAFTIDGAAGKPLGPAGQPVTVQIERANYKAFLQSPQ